MSTTPTPPAFFGTDDKRKEANARRAADRGLESCETCGRGVKPGNGWVVVVVDGGASIASADCKPDENDPGFMGAWLVGPECGKAVPAGFRIRWNGWE